jgi:hypothetical protein
VVRRRMARPGRWARGAACVGTLARKILAVAMAAATSGTLTLGMRSGRRWGAAGEPAGALEDADDLGGGQQDGGVAGAGALGVGGQHLDQVAGSQALGHIAGVGVDGQLDLERCAELLGVDLATAQELAANVEPYIRVDGTKVWSLTQLERQLRPEACRRRRGGYLNRQRTPTDDA